MWDFAAKYGWQAVFNTFGALGYRCRELWIKGCSQPQSDSECIWCVFALVFCAVFYWGMSKKVAGENLI